MDNEYSRFDIPTDTKDFLVSSYKSGVVNATGIYLMGVRHMMGQNGTPDVGDLSPEVIEALRAAMEIGIAEEVDIFALGVRFGWDGWTERNVVDTLADWAFVDRHHPAGRERHAEFIRRVDKARESN